MKSDVLDTPVHPSTQLSTVVPILPTCSSYSNLAVIIRIPMRDWDSAPNRGCVGSKSNPTRRERGPTFGGT